MATKLYLRNTLIAFGGVWSDYGTGNNDTKLNGSTSGWVAGQLSTTAGTGVSTATTSTVAGATNGIEAVESGGAVLPIAWYSPPLDADITISGSITWNIWASESNMSANVAINGRLEVIDGATGAITLIDQTARVAEVGVSPATVNNFAETPAAGIACKRGDRLRVRIFGDDVGTMASGYMFSIFYNADVAASADSWLQLTENLTFVSEPAGTTIYPTDTASAASTASVDREAWTSRGAGVQTDVTNTAAGWTAPIQITDTAGGTVVDWFTRPLTAFTLGGAVRVNSRGMESNAAANASIRCEIARVAGDGTSPTVWAAGTYPTERSTSETADSFLISGDDLSISDGQRLRIRFLIDDFSGAAMASGQTTTLYYAGTSGGASGDTYLTFTQTLTEYTASVTVTPTTAALVATKFAPTVTASDHQLVTPTTKALTSATFVPVLREATTPTTVALTMATFAPTVTATENQLVTPTTVALSTATFAPAVTASDFQLVTPTTKALTLTTFAPAVSTPERATPPTVSLATATFAPSIGVSDNQAVVPTTKALTLATYAPTVTALDPQLVTPTTRALTLTTFAPTVTAAAHQQVTPTTVALTLQAFAPTVTATDQQAVTPTTRALALTTFAPVVSTPQTATPAVVSLALTTYAPTVSNPDPQLVTPTTKSLVLATFAPSISVSDAASIVPPNAALTITTYAPTVIQPDPQLVTPTTPALELHTFEPLVTATAHQAVIPTTAALVTTRHIPTVAATANQSATPSTRALLLTAYAPQVTVNNIVATVTIGLTLTAYAPAVTATTGSYVFPDPASLVLTGYAPLIDLSAFRLVTPATAGLVLTTYPPTAEQHSVTPLPYPIYGFAIVAVGDSGAVGTAQGGATVRSVEEGSTTVSTSGPSARVTIR